MPTLNYSTSVPANRSISEIQAMLVKHGATDVITHYTDRAPTGLSFVLPTPAGERGFTLPVEVERVRLLLVEQSRKYKSVSRSQTTPEHAQRVAWRVLKDWLAAQLAIIEAQMVTLDQVMLPYLRTGRDGTTLYELYRARQEDAVAAIEGGF